MRVLVDTDVLLDVALARQPFAEEALALLEALERRPGVGCIAWHSASNFFYLVSSKSGKDDARAFLRDLVRFVEVAPTTTASLRRATELPMGDFEDAMQVVAALAFRADVIATRNARDFAGSPVPAVAPGEVVERLTGR